MYFPFKWSPSTAPGRKTAGPSASRRPGSVPGYQAYESREQDHGSRHEQEHFHRTAPPFCAGPSPAAFACELGAARFMGINWSSHGRKQGPAALVSPTDANAIYFLSANGSVD